MGRKQVEKGYRGGRWVLEYLQDSRVAGKKVGRVRTGTKTATRKLPKTSGDSKAIGSAWHFFFMSLIFNFSKLLISCFFLFVFFHVFMCLQRKTGGTPAGHHQSGKSSVQDLPLALGYPKVACVGVSIKDRYVVFFLCFLMIVYDRLLR